MAPGLRSDRISSLAETLRSRQMKSGGWAYFDSVQESLEATCLAELALAPERQASSSAAILFLLKSQLSDGGWPAFLGDSEGSWTTALALCTLNSTGDFTAAREKAFRWLYAERGREGTGSGDGNSKPLIATFASIPTSMAGPGFRAPQAGSSPQPSASSPSSNSRSAIAPRNRRNASIWASRCFWTAHVLTEGGTRETALYTECRCARMLRRQRSRCWLSRTNSEPK